MAGEKPREIAARVLRRWAEGRGYVEDLLDAECAKAALTRADRALAHELACGALRWQATLDWLIARKTDGRHQKSMLQILLRLGLYQLFWLDRVPDHAAVHETVQLAKAFGFGSQSGFLNAVLRGYVGERDQTRQALDALKTHQPALGYSHPNWLCDRWQRRWDTGKLRQLLEWNNTPPTTYARVNTLRTNPDELAECWREEKVDYDAKIWDWTGESTVFALKSHPPLATLPSFQQGGFYIQDPSTLLAVSLLDPQPDETVLDLCGAPGGKATYVAQLMSNHGRIIAQEPHPGRLRTLRENCARLGVTCAEFSSPTSIHFPQLSTLFDRALVDAPCSNTGVMRRRVDLRWRIRPEEIERLRGQQLELLHDAAVQLKPGGVLAYSTCSLEPEENRSVVEKFLTAHPDFRLETERELLPFVDGVDGAYVAKLTRQR